MVPSSLRNAERLGLAARRSGQRLFVVLGGRQAQLPRQLGIEGRDRGRGAVIGLRRFVETLRSLLQLLPFAIGFVTGRIPLANLIALAARRGTGTVRGRLATRAAIERIIRRRLQPGRGPDAALAAIDRGIEQVGQRRSDRLHVGSAGFGFCGFAAPFRGVGILRHGANMGLVPPT